MCKLVRDSLRVGSLKIKKTNIIFTPWIWYPQPNYIRFELFDPQQICDKYNGEKYEYYNLAQICWSQSLDAIN